MEIPECVIEEAKNLKIHATKEELSRLDFYTLDPDHQNKCIYGQMTGSCVYTRAIELIEKCAERVYKQVDRPGDSIELNGSPVGLKRSWANYAYYSPIEVWIAKGVPGFNEKLIKYLKGEIESL